MIGKVRHIAIIGDGGWGTTLAIHLTKKLFSVTLWGPFPEYLNEVRQKRYNPKFLPGIFIPQEIQILDRLEEVLKGADLIVFAVPSQYAVGVLRKLKKYDLSGKSIVSVVKGIVESSLQCVSQLIHQELGAVPVAVLSGPTIAREVARGIPSTAAMASKNQRLAKILQSVFNSETFRIYTNSDVLGVELGGSLKNIIAIACGVCDGLGFGTNTKAAIMTRGLAEITRLGVALGAKSKTFYGLTGLGDLATTCMSPQSRNRWVGEQLGQGKTIHEITSSMNMVAEGVPTVKAVHRLSQRHKISMPITTEVYNIIYKQKKPKKAVNDLMTRKLKSE